MQDNSDVSWIGYVVAWLLTVFGGGIAYGKLTIKVNKHEKLLYNSEGEPRIITFPAHDIMVANCHNVLDIKLNTLDSNMSDMKSDIKELLKAVQQINLDQAGHNHKHHRKEDEAKI